jgi:hypothetical protein
MIGKLLAHYVNGEPVFVLKKLLWKRGRKGGPKIPKEWKIHNGSRGPQMFENCVNGWKWGRGGTQKTGRKGWRRIGLKGPNKNSK